MDSLEYSNDALEVIPSFYNCDFSIYVEGDDDVIFWEHIFRISNKNVHVEEVGGVKELEKYVSKILDDNVNIYVAKDNDYSDFLDINLTHERIFTTYGHSIENTFYNLSTIKSIIKKFSKVAGQNLPRATEEEICLRIQEFENKIKPILIYEIANEVYQKGHSILGTNSCRFLKNKNSTELCDIKIDGFITGLTSHFSEEEVINVSNKIEQIGKTIWSMIRGHFLTNFVANLIKDSVKGLCGKKISLPLDVLYPLFIDQTSISNSEHIQHYNYA
ncbi:DUF4435 domain-containing protein [Flavobacterium sp. JP2137]|uniref:DUF4435 domain-containing protein n=1 Tax=Flavobacterium sp. JP2137 TaxID=3414510 RepID=UPI003D2FF4F4